MPLDLLQAFDPRGVLQEPSRLVEGKQVVVKIRHKPLGQGLVQRSQRPQPLGILFAQLQKCQAGAQRYLVPVSGPRSAGWASCIAIAHRSPGHPAGGLA